MSFNLESIATSTQLPPRTVVYGVPGIGKTTFASAMPNPIFIPVEDGLGQLEVPTFPRPKTFTDVLDAIDTLISNDHNYRTLVIDSLDKLEPVIWDHVLANVPHEKGQKLERIEEYGYGKGYTHALTEWRTLLKGLDFLREEKGMAICVIAHSTIVKFDHPEGDPYDRYQLRLHKHANAVVLDWADAVLFCNYEVTVIPTSGDKKRGVGKGERSVYTSERPAFAAKNRYCMDDRLALDWDEVAPFLGYGNPKPKPKPKPKPNVVKA